jgi:hypothetical protein
MPEVEIVEADTFCKFKFKLKFIFFENSVVLLSFLRNKTKGDTHETPSINPICSYPYVSDVAVRQAMA